MVESFWPTEKNDTRTYDGIEIATEKGNNYTSGCLVGYPYFKGKYKLIAINIRKKQKQKQNLSLKTQAVLLICSLELTISGVPAERTYQKSEKCRLCEEWLSEDDFEVVLEILCCYDYGANASEAVQKIAEDSKDYHKYSSCVAVCWIAKIYQSIAVRKAWLISY